MKGAQGQQYLIPLQTSSPYVRITHLSRCLTATVTTHLKLPDDHVLRYGGPGYVCHSQTQLRSAMNWTVITSSVSSRARAGCPGVMHRSTCASLPTSARFYRIGIVSFQLTSSYKLAKCCLSYASSGIVFVER